MRVFRRNLFRVILFFGMALTLGLGFAIPNDFDMLFRLAGAVVMVGGAVGLIASKDVDREEDEWEL